MNESKEVPIKRAFIEFFLLKESKEVKFKIVGDAISCEGAKSCLVQFEEEVVLSSYK